jgi:hypothetical protein
MRFGAAAVLLWLVFARTPVSAAVYLEPFRVSGPPGTVIHARTPSFGLSGIGRSLAAFLAPADANVSSPQSPGLTPLGQLRLDQKGIGTLTFRIPDVPPGSYVVVLHCEACAANSFGRTMATVQEVTIEHALPGTDRSPVTWRQSDGSPAGLLIAAIMGVAGAASMSRRLRSRGSPATRPSSRAIRLRA